MISAAAGVSNMRDGVAPSLRLLQALAAAVLVIACANLASLLLARGMARRIETAVRVALGASRMRLVAQFLLESLLLAGAGGLAGLLVSFAGARAIVNLAFRGATDIPVDPSPSLLVIGFAFGASIVTGALFGAAPAVVGSRSDPIEALRGASRTTSERGGRIRGVLIALQVALSLVLMTCAGLLGRSLQQLEAQDFGVAIDSRYVVTLAPSLTMVGPEQLPAMYARMQERLLRIPGVANAAFSLYAPMSRDNYSGSVVVEGHDASERLTASWNRVSARYFDTVGTPVVRGRAFDERDRPGSPLVALVTESFARKFFGDADPIGRRIGQRAPEIEIVGVVGDAKYQDGRRAPREMFFLPYLQETAESRARAAAAGIKIDRTHYPQAIEIQVRGVVQGLEAEVRRALADVDGRITVRQMISMDEQVARAFNIERLIARLTVAFGLVALLLACLGLYGVTAYLGVPANPGDRPADGGRGFAAARAGDDPARRAGAARHRCGHWPSGGSGRGTVAAVAVVRHQRARPALDCGRPHTARSVSRAGRAAAREPSGGDGSGQSAAHRITPHTGSASALPALTLESAVPCKISDLPSVCSLRIAGSPRRPCWPSPSALAQTPPSSPSSTAGICRTCRWMKAIASSRWCRATRRDAGEAYRTSTFWIGAAHRGRSAVSPHTLTPT